MRIAIVTCIDILDRAVCIRHLEERKEGERRNSKKKITSKLRAMEGRKEVG